MSWSSCNQGEEKHGQATEPLSLFEPADPPCLMHMHSLTESGRQRQHNPDPDKHRHQRANITLFSRSFNRPSLFYSCSLHPATPRLLPCSRQNTDGKSFCFYQVVILVLFCSIRLGLSLSVWATWELHCITAWGGSNTRLQIAFSLQQAVPDKWTSYEHSLLDIHQWLATKDAQSKWVFSKKWITIKSRGHYSNQRVVKYGCTQRYIKMNIVSSMHWLICSICTVLTQLIIVKINKLFFKCCISSSLLSSFNSVVFNREVCGRTSC